MAIASSDCLLALVIVGSFALKLILAVHLKQLPPRADEIDYATLAGGLLAKGEYLSLFRPPLWPATIAVVTKLVGSLGAVRLLNAILSTFTLFFVYAVSCSVGGVRVGRLATALVAFDPVLITFADSLWSETLFIFLFWAMLSLLVWRFSLSTRWRWFAAGVLLGAAGLTRPVVLTLAPLFVLYCLYRGWQTRDHRAADCRGDRSRLLGGALICSVLLTLGACSVVLPWTLRNYRKTGAIVLVDTNGAYNLLLGTEPDAAFHDKDDVWNTGWGRLGGVPYRLIAERDPGYAQQRAVEAAIGYIAAQPFRYLAKCIWEGNHLWTLDSFLLRHLRNGWYGRETPHLLLPLALVVSVPWSAMLIAFGLIGILAMPPSPFRGFAGLTLLHAAILFALLFSLSRFQVPLRPLLAVSCAWLLTHPQVARQRLRRGATLTRRGMVAVGILLFVACSWARDLPLLSDMLTDHGAAYRFVTVNQADARGARLSTH